MASIAWLLCGTETVRACSCAVGKFEPCRAYGSASAVFVGVATGVEKRNVEDVRAERKREGGDRNSPSMIYSFAVEEAFGGVEGSEVKIGTNSGGGDCGYQFAKGERYLIYAYGRKDNLSTSICTPTKPIGEAAEDELKFLRALGTREPGVTLSGAVVTSYPTKENAEPPVDKRVVGLPVIVEGEGERRELQTDARGRYQLAGLKAGTYTVKIVPPDELHTHRAEEKVVIAERGCGGATFFITDNGRISGKATDAEGHPVARLTVNALSVEEAKKELPNMSYAQTDEEGGFKFEALPAGRYLLGVRLGEHPEPDNSATVFPRVYYPGVETEAQAEPVTIGAGEHVKELTLRLPPRRAPRVLRGEVVWADGRPVKHAIVFFGEVTYRKQVVEEVISADESGRFTINAYNGLTYYVEAMSKVRGTGNERSERVRITVGDGKETVLIRINPSGGMP